MRFRSGPALRFVTALMLAAVFAPLCAGQTGAQGTRAPRTDPGAQRGIQREVDRELMFKGMMDSVERGDVGTQTGARPARLMAQLKEDFARLQVVNNELARARESGGELDFKMVAQSASEIKKRAGRLKENLLLPEPAEDRPKASSGIDAWQLRAALAELDRLVFSFVHNPGFQSVRVIDAEWSAKARSDLERIIELSGRVKKSSERLHRAAQKSH